MQQTTKYKFNLIETSDTFSPDALNANARAAETELARVEAAHAADKAALEAADAALTKTAAANKTALEQALATQKSELSATDAANKAALEQSLATLKSTHTADKAALDTAIKALNADVHPGAFGQIARVAINTYAGTGTAGSANQNCLKFDFKPVLIFISSANEKITVIMMRPSVYTISGDMGACTLVWGEKSVNWYSPGINPILQCNEKGKTYSYVAIGVTV